MTQLYDGHYSREKSGTILFQIHFYIYMNGLLFKILLTWKSWKFISFYFVIYSFPYLFLLFLYFSGYLILIVNDWFNIVFPVRISECILVRSLVTLLFVYQIYRGINGSTKSTFCCSGFFKETSYLFFTLTVECKHYNQD